MKQVFSCGSQVSHLIFLTVLYYFINGQCIIFINQRIWYSFLFMEQMALSFKKMTLWGHLFQGQTNKIINPCSMYTDKLSIYEILKKMYWRNWSLAISHHHGNTHSASCIHHWYPNLTMSSRRTWFSFSLVIETISISAASYQESLFSVIVFSALSSTSYLSSQ